MNSTLYIVSTPIGNLEDITLRAINTLKEVNLIACEDTRTTKKLLARYQIENQLTSYHEHNEVEKAKELVSLLKEGKSIALVTDAGTPGISDPGYRIVRLASENGINVVAVPGASAVIAALSISGLSTSSFTFLGFPPRQNKCLNEFLRRYISSSETLIFYESPKRIIKTLEVIYEVLCDRNMSLSREITKLFEETIRGRVSDVISILKSRDSIKGEFVLVVEGSTKEDKMDAETVDELLTHLKREGHTLKDAVKQISVDSGISKSIVYKKALAIWK